MRAALVFIVTLGMASAAGLEAPARDGALIFSGGGDNSGLWTAMGDLLDGAKGRVIVLSVGTMEGQDFDEFKDCLPGQVDLFNLGDASSTPESLDAALKDACGVWLSPGNWQGLDKRWWRPLSRGVAGVVERGGAVGACGKAVPFLARRLAEAGAESSSRTGGLDLRRLGSIEFFDDANPDSLGSRAKKALSKDGLLVSLDPATGWILRGDRAEVYGAGEVRVGRNKEGASQTVELTSGDAFDLATKEVVPRKAAEVVRVAVYQGLGASQRNADVAVQCLREDKQFQVRKLGAEEIQNGALAKVDVFILGGGRASEQADALGEVGREAVRKFVRDGGGYIGMNAGAYLAAADRSYYLHILNAKVVDREHWNRGSGDVQIRFTKEGREILDAPFRTAQILYSNSPLLVRDAQTDLPSYDELAFYETEVVSKTAPAGVMRGTSAMECAPYGRGRVFCSSLPPRDNNPDWKPMLRRAVLWVANRTEPAPARVSE